MPRLLPAPKMNRYDRAGRHHYILHLRRRHRFAKMRWSASFNLLLLARAWSVAASSLSQPIIYTYDPLSSSSSSDSIQDTVDPETARLIFAQRLGLSQFHSLGDADDTALRHINTYGGQSQQLFGLSSHHAERSRAFIMIEGTREIPGSILFSFVVEGVLT